MQSRPELSLETRTLLLILLLFLAGGSLRFDSLREAVNSPYQGGTYLFISLLFDLVQDPKTLQNIYNHTAETSSLLKYFSLPENIDDSYWWLQHKKELLTLSSDEQTYVMMAENPWLFRSIRNLIETNPTAYEKGISNRTLFISILQLAEDYPEVRALFGSGPTLAFLIDNPNLTPFIRQLLNNTQIRQILTENPALIPFFLNNPTINLPTDPEWILILQPANTTQFSRQIDIVALYHITSLTSGISLTLLQGSSTIGTLNGTTRPTNSSSTFLYAARLDPANLSEGDYTLKAEVTLLSGSSLVSIVAIHLIETTPEEPTPRLLTSYTRD